MHFQAVIFDLDGTLADTLDDIADAMNAALAHLGQPTHAREDYRAFVGAGVVNLARVTLPQDRQDLLDRAVELFRTHYQAHIVDRTRAFPDVGAMLDALVARGLKLAVLSNKIDAMTRRIVDSCFASWPLFPVFGERAGVPKKPDPQAALEIAQLLGAEPGRCAFVGDTAYDILTAVNAGMYPVGVTWGFRTREEMVGAGAKAMIDSPLDLLPTLERVR